MSDQPVAITFLGDQKEKEVTYQNEDEVITYQNNNLEDEETKYVVSKLGSYTHH